MAEGGSLGLWGSFSHLKAACTCLARVIVGTQRKAEHRRPVIVLEGRGFLLPLAPDISLGCKFPRACCPPPLSQMGGTVQLLPEAQAALGNTWTSLGLLSSLCLSEEFIQLILKSQGPWV